MRKNQSKCFPTVACVVLPGVAHAQHVSLVTAAGILSPIIVFSLAVLLGILAGSWRIGLIHAVLVIVWVGIFVIASQEIENDYVIWTPLVIYIIHALFILVSVITKVTQRFRARN